MSALDWMEVQGQKFDAAESREASDFEEILENFGMTPDESFHLFQKESLTVSKRLVFAVRAFTDDVIRMMLSDEDVRIREVIKERLKKERLDAGIIH